MRSLRTAAMGILCFVIVAAALFGMSGRPVSAQQQDNTYVVQPGDNLYRISLRFGVTQDELARANGIVNPNIVVVGQRLVIPTKPGAVTPAATSAATQAATASGSATINPTAASSTAVPVVTVPAATASASPAATTDAGIILPGVTKTAVPAATTAAGTPAPAPTQYTVQPNDNLYRISLKFGTTMQALMQLNNITNPNLVYVGQVLNLPPQAAQPAPTTAPGATGTAATATPLTGGGPASTAVQTAAATTANTAGNVGFGFGIVLSADGQDAATVAGQAKDLGMTWVKIPVSWRKIEAVKGTIDTTDLDKQIEAFAGTKILLTVTNAPDWARQTAAENGPPNNFTDYANFIGAIATRYKGKVTAYEIWHEPNIRREWAGKPLSAASYVELLRLAYAAVKRADPAALVISAGLSPTGFNDGVNALNDRVFLRQAFAAGMASFVDAVGVHPGGWANPPDSTCCTASPGVSGWFNDRSFYFRDTLKDYRDIMIQNSASGIFLWATEFGWGSSDSVVSDPNLVDQNYGFVKFTSQTQQAQYIPRAYELARTLGYVGPMFLYNLNACSTSVQPNSSEFRSCYFSLLNAAGEPRPAYNALKAAPK